MHDPDDPLKLTADTVADGPQKRVQAAGAGDDPRPAKPLPDNRPADPPRQHAGGTPAPARIGPYLVEERLGQGGMGEVLAVRDFRFDRQLALKRLAPFPTSAFAQELFLSEMRVTASLDHPHIVPVLDRGTEDDGRPWFVMPRLRGRPLKNELQQGGVPLTDRLQIYLKVACAVAHAHRRGVLHLDLKPANIWCGPEGSVYVLDWGIARPLSESPISPERALGTPRYMAPEQKNPTLGRADVRTDVFGLGALLYAVICRRPPPLPHPTSELALTPLDDDLSPRLANILRRATAPSAVDRHQSVDELMADVQDVFSASPWVMLIQRSVKAGEEERFEAWASELGQIATAFAGHQALTHVRLPSDSAATSTYLMIARFASSEHARAFDDSPERAQLLALAEEQGFTENVRRIDGRGHEAWFTLESGSTLPSSSSD